MSRPSRSRSVLHRAPSGSRSARLARKLRRAERALRAARDEAEAAAQARWELLSVVTHDLRNPLSVVVVSTGLLQRRFTEAEGSPRRLVDAIGRATDEMNRLISDLVDAGRIERGALELTPQAHEPSAPVVSALDALRSRASHHRVELALLLPDEPPPLVLADPDAVTRVVSNLVGHSLRFLPRDAHLTVRLEPTVGAIVYTIHDDGPGLSPAQLAGAFARRQPRGARLTQGVGLEVYVAKGIVEAQGGSLSLTSREGVGCTFTFTLPLAERAT